MLCVELGGSYSPRRHWCFKQPDFGSKGPGPAYRLLMTFGNADDLAYEFATYCIATPGRPTQTLALPDHRTLKFGHCPKQGQQEVKGVF
jgi:hypothetical protein